VLRRLALGAAACLLWPAAAPAQQPAFTAAPDMTFAATSKPVSIAAADFDNDGRQDLVVGNYVENTVYVRLGNGDGTFSNMLSINGLASPHVAVGDLFNADGNQDLVVGNATAGDELAIFGGNGTGLLIPGPDVDLPAAARRPAIGDFNGDGKVDVAAGSETHVMMRLGNGEGEFTGGTDVATTQPTFVATGDFDGNGNEDVAYARRFQQSVIGVLPGTGTGAFGTVKTTPIPDIGVDVAVGDFDADGREDVASTIGPQDKLAVRLGNGDGTFAAAPDIAVGGEPVNVAVGDFDADGREDLAVSNADDDEVRLLAGNGDGTFRDGGRVRVGDYPQGIAVADFNGDGRQDLAVANFDGGSVSVRLGAGPTPGNLLANGGFESAGPARIVTQSPAIPGWTRTGGMTFVRYGVLPHLGFPSELDAPRHGGGTAFLWGGESVAGVTTASQTVDVSGSAAAIDAGRATAGLSALLGGSLHYPDHMTATADFLGAGGATLGSLTIGPVTKDDRRNLTTMLPRAGRAAVPAGTRSIRVTLTSTDADTISSATADNVRLTLDAPQPPGPPPSGPGGPAGFGAATKVSVKLAAGRIRARGPLRVLVSNANAFGVTGTLSGRAAGARLRRKRFSVAAGGRRTVALALPKAVRRTLARRKKVVLRLSASVVDPAGNRRTVARRVVPRLKKRR
jgi:VCBS repeat protein